MAIALYYASYRGSNVTDGVGEVGNQLVMTTDEIRKTLKNMQYHIPICSFVGKMDAGGVAAYTVPGVLASDVATASIVLGDTGSGVTTTLQKCVCTANTVTITTSDNVGGTSLDDAQVLVHVYRIPAV